MELISLNLIYDYPVRWTKFKVLRDFVQNFYDAVKWCEWKKRFSYTLSDGVLQLKARDVGFSYDWLLHIGASTKIIQIVSSRLSPDASAVVLHALKRRWYEQPHKKYDFESWHGIIKTLIRNIAGSAEQTAAWREANPNLLVARQVKRNDISRYNSRRQALDWLKISGGGFRLVQGAFVELGYPVLEDVCEKNGGCGHRSVYFSRALSTLMEITLSNAGLIAEWQKKW